MPMPILELSTDSRQDRGLMEIFAHSSIAANFYDSYRFLALLSMRPDIRDYYRRRYGYPDGLPALDTTKDIRKALAGRLVMVLHFAGDDLWIARNQELPPERSLVLSSYSGFVEDASRLISHRLFRIEPVIQQLQNPLTPATTERLWNRPNELPQLEELLQF